MTNHNFLFVSLDGLIGDIAWRVQEQGNDVKYAITEDPYSQDVTDGIVPKVDEWQAHIDWADLIIFDDGFGLGTHAEQLREHGNQVIGGTQYTDRLETDRGFGHSEMEDRDLSVIASRIFDDLSAGIEYVRAHPNPYVIKPCGPTQNFNELLYVGQADDGEDVIQMMERYRDVWHDQIDEFQLQRRKQGVEISVCRFFDGSQFVGPVNYTFEHKRLFPDELGPMTGEMGTSMFWGQPNTLYKETIAPFESVLGQEGYVGPFDINCIVNAEGIFPLEITPRFGYPQILIQEAAMKTPISTFLFELATTNDPDLAVHDGQQVGFRVCVPPFPADDMDWFEAHTRNLVVRFRGEGIPEGIHLEDIKYTDGEYRVAGETGEVLVITGRGKTMGSAQQQAYQRAKEVILPNKFFRSDIGDRWYREARLLKKWGYFKEDGSNETAHGPVAIDECSPTEIGL